jgi:hypothetical protein
LPPDEVRYQRSDGRMVQVKVMTPDKLVEPDNLPFKGDDLDDDEKLEQMTELIKRAIIIVDEIL